MAREDPRDDRRDWAPWGSSRAPRLDVPRDTRRKLLPQRSFDPEALGRSSERIARFLGTGTFLVVMTVVIVAWFLWNTLGPEGTRWDVYPFIFLTLMLSLQASYSAPLILLAANRQEARDRVNLEQDREANARAHADMEFLAREMAALRMAIGEVATRDFIRSELRALVVDLEERVRADGTAGSEIDDQSTSTRGPARSLEA